ncbi:uncharacterized protein KY384_001953 [Bacidia gigantensis]|uniref:uncharacterized protein n=1 Tax=Bacidia gigantensis TaxID=2732470 RepID=UPI001D055D73|nr:uncharacterized protein KY384_001953 [Bacidia gigantensis]KAG8533170.1 hypothetical protein KY384_001953 [Bacidia gigantensis]
MAPSKRKAEPSTHSSAPAAKLGKLKKKFKKRLHHRAQAGSNDSPEANTSTKSKPIKKGVAIKSKGPKSPTKSNKSRRQANGHSTVVNESPSSKVSVNISLKDNSSQDDSDEGHEESDGPQYWLMKAEPESRIEKGKDVKFSIDDLNDAKEAEPWDDNAYPAAESAFDPKHPYYDEKSNRDNPKWCVVHVEYRRKFQNMVKLKELQKYGKEGGVLQAMPLLKQSRLSVSKVSKNEWDFIMTLVDEDIEVIGA